LLDEDATLARDVSSSAAGKSVASDAIDAAQHRVARIPTERPTAEPPTPPPAAPRADLFGGTIVTATTSSAAGSRAGNRRRGAAPRTGAKRTLIGTITQIPQYLRLMAGLLTDPRVSALDKVLLGVAIAYVVTPIDLIPDFIPFLGQVDDAFILVLAIRRLIKNAGMRVVRDHWEGPIEDLHPTALQEVIMAAAFFLPRGIRRRLRKIAR
jgi:uncharacterized membrane protein YkvA (DUF1232 family)